MKEPVSESITCLSVLCSQSTVCPCKCLPTECEEAVIYCNVTLGCGQTLCITLIIQRLLSAIVNAPAIAVMMLQSLYDLIEKLLALDN